MLDFSIVFFLMTLGQAVNTSNPPPQADLLSRVDHIVYATPDLTRGVEEIEKLLGVRAAPGGQHPGRGTHNALVALGPASYLEIIAPDPQQPPPAGARPFGIDGLSRPTLVAWAAKSGDLAQLVREAAAKGIRLGEVRSGSRKRPDGVLISWRFTDPSTVLANGVVPFFIDWTNSPHPSQTATPGATLVELRAEHQEPEPVRITLRDLGIPLPVKSGPQPALIAVIECPRGRIELR